MSEGRLNSRFFIFLLLVLIVPLFLLTYPFTVTISPSYCATCHLMSPEFKSWTTSPHKKADCLSCHRDKIPFGVLTFKARQYSMLASQVTGIYQKPITSDINNQNCLSCHQKQTEKLLVSRTIRVSHKEFLAKGARCTDCHNTVAHRNTVPRKKYPHMDKCTVCHNGTEASADCYICHTKEKSKKPRYRMGPWAITHGETWTKTHGMGSLATCQVCHPEDYCMKCHEIKLPHPSVTWPANHGKIAKNMKDNCITCHIASFCENCHQIEMPHPANWLPRHSRIAKSIDDKDCRRCHARYDCQECHKRHIHRAVKHR